MKKFLPITQLEKFLPLKFLHISVKIFMINKLKSLLLYLYSYIDPTQLETEFILNRGKKEIEHKNLYRFELNEIF